MSLNTNRRNEVNLLDYWRVIRKHAKSIIAIVVITSIAAVIISLLLPKQYRAKAVIIPVSSQDNGGMAGMASQFSGLASVAGLNMLGGLTDDTAKIMAILRSRTLTENVIKSKNLMPVLFKDDWDSSRGTWKSSDPLDQPNMEMGVRALKQQVGVMEDNKGQTIEITAMFKDPELPARVVNAYLEELQKFINANAFTTAKRNRIFIEGQLQENKRGFLEAGKEINEFYKQNSISSVEANIDVNIENVIGQVEMGQGAEPLKYANLDVQSIKQLGSDIGNLVTQKADLDEKIRTARIVEDVPQQVYLTYLMMRRELLAKINALLTSQFEMAKIEESKEELSFQIIDKAVVPFKKYKPKRAQICVISFFGALFFAVFLAFFREYLRKLKAEQG